jgi:hypothetical protein
MMSFFAARRSVPFLLLALLIISLPASGAAPRPAAPKEFDVQLRYRIYAARTERIRQYLEMTKALDSAGLKRDEGEITEAEDPSETMLTGKLAADNVARVMRQRHVKAILLTPVDYKLPDEGVVRVQIRLASGLPLNRQRMLHEQTAGRIANLGFREYPSYDHEGFTRMVGAIPVGDVSSLLKDVRWVGGWALPDLPVAALPEPIKSISPIRIIEVTPEPEGTVPPRDPPAPPVPPEKGQEHTLKISPDLLALAGKDDIVRMEVILGYVPTGDDPWKRILGPADVVIEGRLGPLVTVRGSAKQADVLAQQTAVSVVRLARPATPQAQLPKGIRDGNLDALNATGLFRLHTYKNRGKGMKVVVIDGDFRGYEAFVGKKKFPRLPATTRYLDFTAERNANLMPDPFPGDPKQPGHGTELALATSFAAPEADMTLVRIDPASPHQLQQVARYINGEPFRSESYDQRFDEIEFEKIRLRNNRDKLLVERRIALNIFGEDKESVEKRQAYFKKQEAHDAEEKAYVELLDRYEKLRKDYASLKDTQVVTSALVWNTGYPMGGASPLSQYFDDRPFKAALWFQSAGNTRGQAWSGLFRDSDGNGIMEFAPADAPLRPERWTPELNFLGWKPYGKRLSPEMPEKVKLRLTMQWREVHSPEFFRQTDDPYLTPLAQVRLVLLKQRDPKGEKLFGDDMEIVAYSTGLPQRLEARPKFAIYEQTLEFTVEPTGRYALRVDGYVPPTTRPLNAPRIEKADVTWEMRPRIFLDVVGDDFRRQGRAVFIDYPTDLGTLGMPADSNSLLTVGSADLATHRPEEDSASGPAWNLELLKKPDLWAYDGLRLLPDGSGECIGTSRAAGFAAGLTAAAFSAGTDRIYFLKAMRERANLGKPLQVP